MIMKYTARHIQKFIEQGKIDPTLWKNHFPSLLPTQVPACEDCEDFKDRTCKGEREPVECFLAVQLEAENQPGAEEEKKRWKARDPMLGIGPKGRSIPGGANRSRDQSKM
jgi:hypothetical protein